MHKSPVTELYDLRKDPTEANDLAKTSGKDVARLLKIAEAEHTPSEMFPLRAIDKR
jgi:arylsulfatase